MAGFISLREVAESFCDETEPLTADGAFYNRIEAYGLIAQAWGREEIDLYGRPWDTPGSELLGTLGEVEKIDPYPDRIIDPLGRRDPRMYQRHNSIDNKEWRELTIREEDAKLFASRHRGSSSPTIKGETDCKNWLVGLMKNGSCPDRSKADYEVCATKEGFKIGKRAFQRAWRNAVTETGNASWEKSGRKSKRRIDTPV